MSRTESHGLLPGLDPSEESGLERAHRADRFHDECGVFGVHGHPEASRITYLGLYALQHRGQESAGIVSCDGREHLTYRSLGLVAAIFGEKALDKLTGRHAVE